MAIGMEGIIGSAIDEFLGSDGLVDKTIGEALDGDGPIETLFSHGWDLPDGRTIVPEDVFDAIDDKGVWPLESDARAILALLGPLVIMPVADEDDEVEYQQYASTLVDRLAEHFGYEMTMGTPVKKGVPPGGGGGPAGGPPVPGLPPMYTPPAAPPGSMYTPPAAPPGPGGSPPAQPPASPPPAGVPPTGTSALDTYLTTRSATDAVEAALEAVQGVLDINQDETVYLIRHLKVLLA